MSVTIDQIREIVGVELSEAEAQALAESYAGLARNVARFPAADLKAVEPPLRSIAGPRA
jgi:hypothetical protein